VTTAPGELGNGTLTQEDTSASGEHGLALLADGKVMAWGDNDHGQLGNGTTTDSDVPVAVKGLAKVKAVSAGYLFSVAVLTNGTVMAWGYNGNGQLGNGTYNDSDVPVAVTGLTGASTVAAGGQAHLAEPADTAFAAAANGTPRPTAGT
jgi:alpha-tubulin suppressor-like RCC1 family protein